jgi:uncharacterized protein (TIGR02147 family)
MLERFYRPSNRFVPHPDNRPLYYGPGGNAAVSCATATNAMTSRKNISVFDYTDYRKFLLDYYKAQKTVNPVFSYRYFARVAGTSSVGLYKDIVEGRLALGRVMTGKFSKALKLNKREAEYFEHMVLFNEARTIEEQKRFFERMLALCQPHERIVDSDRYEYYSHWYYSALRAVLMLIRWRDDWAALAGMLDPPISLEQAHQGVEVLERLGMITRDAEGYAVVSDPTISTGRLTNNATVQVMNIKNFQCVMTDLGKQALDRFATQDIDMSTLTIAVSLDTMRRIKEEIAGLRQRVKALAERDESPQRVFQLNYQFFPLSKVTLGQQSRGAQ